MGLYDSKLYYMQQIEDYLIDDDSSKGFSTILDEMFNALETLKGTPESLDARKQFISKSQNFADFFKHFSRDILILPELGDNVGAESSCDAQVFFLHIAVDQQFPESFVAHCHSGDIPSFVEQGELYHYHGNHTIVNELIFHSHELFI